MTLKNIITTCCLLFSLLKLSGAPVPARKVPVPVSDVVRTAVFDEKGCLWIGTTAGLLRYDGYNFTQYRNTLSRQLLLSDNSIQSLCADKRGKLWAGTDNGVTCMDLRTGVTAIFRMPGRNRRRVFSIFADKEGTVWAGTENGLFRKAAADNNFRTVKGTAALNIKAIADNGHGCLMAGTWADGLWMVLKNGHGARRVSVDGKNFFCLKYDRRGRLWAGSWTDGIKLITAAESRRPAVKTFRGTGREPVYNIDITPGGHVLACSRSEVYHIDKALAVRTDKDSAAGMNACVAANGLGTVALIKKTDGIELYSTFNGPLSVIDVPPYDDGMLRGSLDGLLTTDGNIFWMLSKTSGLSLFNRTEGKARHYSSIPALRGLKNDLTATSCQAAMTDRRGTTWLANNFYGLIRIGRNGKTQTIDHNVWPAMAEDGVYSMTEDRQGRLWFGQTRNVVVAWPDGRVRNIQLSRFIKGIGTDEVTDITEDHDGKIWICTRGSGLLRIDFLPAGNRAVRATALNRANGRYCSAGATACVTDRQHNIFFISSSGELLQWDNRRKRCRQMSTGTDERLYAATTDYNGDVWLAASNYIIRMQHDGKGNVSFRRFYNTGHNRGLLFEENAVCSNGSMLYFGAHNNCIIAIDTRRAERTMPAGIRLAVTGLAIDGQQFDELDSTLKNRISMATPVYTKEITIPSGVHRFELTFANLDFANEGIGERYAYRLDGYNNGWVATPQGGHSAVFDNLPAGSYTFRVRCTDLYGHWTEMPYSISVRVLPPWWLTWQAYIIYIAAAAITVILIRRQQRIRKKKPVPATTQTGGACLTSVALPDNGDSQQQLLQQKRPELCGNEEQKTDALHDENEDKKQEERRDYINTSDKLFLDRCIKTVMNNIGRDGYDREQFAADMCMSGSSLYKKLRALTGDGVTAFINRIRLKEACRIMNAEPDIQISSLYVRVGYNSPAYFRRLFKQEYGITPSEYLLKIQQQQTDK